MKKKKKTTLKPCLTNLEKYISLNLNYCNDHEWHNYISKMKTFINFQILSSYFILFSSWIIDSLILFFLTKEYKARLITIYTYIIIIIYRTQMIDQVRRYIIISFLSDQLYYIKFVHKIIDQLTMSAKLRDLMTSQGIYVLIVSAFYLVYFRIHMPRVRLQLKFLVSNLCLFEPISASIQF